MKGVWDRFLGGVIWWGARFLGQGGLGQLYDKGSEGSSKKENITLAQKQDSNEILSRK
jgi:hypothetical protein